MKCLELISRLKLYDAILLTLPNVGFGCGAARIAKQIFGKGVQSYSRC